MPFKSIFDLYSKEKGCLALKQDFFSARNQGKSELCKLFEVKNKQSSLLRFILRISLLKKRH